MGAKKKKYSYIKYPFSVNGWYALISGCLGLGLGTAVAASAVLAPGGISLFLTSLGACSLIFSGAALLFCLLCFREKERNHVPGAAGGILAFLALLLWAWILVF